MGLRDRQLDDYYTEALATLSSPGWAYIIEDLGRIRDRASNIKVLTDDKGLHFAQGQLDILDHVIGLKDLMDTAYERLCEQGASDA